MRCPGCGQQAPPNSRFCNACGVELGMPTDPASTSSESPDATASFASEGFVGRQREMAQLQTALQGTLSGQGQLVMLVGEPGIGKTRTAQELAVYAEEQGAQVLWGRCFEGEGAPPYWP